MDEPGNSPEEINAALLQQVAGMEKDMQSLLAVNGHMADALASIARMEVDEKDSENRVRLAVVIALARSSAGLPLDASVIEVLAPAAGRSGSKPNETGTDGPRLLHGRQHPDAAGSLHGRSLGRFRSSAAPLPVGKYGGEGRPKCASAPIGSANVTGPLLVRPARPAPCHSSRRSVDHSRGWPNPHLRLPSSSVPLEADLW